MDFCVNLSANPLILLTFFLKVLYCRDKEVKRGKKLDTHKSNEGFYRR